MTYQPMQPAVARGVIVVAVVLALVMPGVMRADASPSPARPATVATSPTVSDAMRALDWLARHGYTWTTDAGAANAIRHWQRVNGLVIDGLVGSETLRSMGLDRSRPVLPTVTKSRPAARPAQPAAPSVDSSPPPVNEVGDVESIIRDVWPADLANRAVKIATRESNLQPGVSNSCCYGLFQIHWRANRAHLIPLGITDPSQLFDARTNAEAALAIYQLSGWAPWACHGKCQDV